MYSATLSQLSDGIYVMSNLQQNTDGPFYRWHQEQFMPQDIHPGIQLLGAREIDQFVIKGMSGIRVTDRAEVRTAIIAWASQFVRTRWAPDAQPPARVARDMLDARVRDYDEKERTETQIWMGQGMEIDDIVMGIHVRAAPARPRTAFQRMLTTLCYCRTVKNTCTTS